MPRVRWDEVDNRTKKAGQEHTAERYASCTVRWSRQQNKKSRTRTHSWAICLVFGEMKWTTKQKKKTRQERSLLVLSFVGISGSVVSLVTNGSMIGGWWFSKDLEGSCHGLIEVLSLNLAGSTAKSVSRPRLEMRTSVIRVKRYRWTQNKMFFSLTSRLWHCVKHIKLRALVRQRTIPTERPPLVG
jgi:hypothetical protein